MAVIKLVIEAAQSTSAAAVCESMLWSTAADFHSTSNVALSIGAAVTAV